MRDRVSAVVVLSNLALLSGCDEIRNTFTDPDVETATLILTTASTTLVVNGATTVTIQAKRGDGSPVKDGTEIGLTVTVGRLDPAKVRTAGGQATTTYRASAQPGSARIGATSGKAKAELTLTIEAEPVKPPAETAPPAPPLAPPPPSPSSGVGSLDLRQVAWLDTDVSGWAVTSRITRVVMDAPPICLEHTKAGQWPVADQAEGNPWVFAQVAGRWYAATWEWLALGQTCKYVSAQTIGPHIGRSPLTTWQPRSGEVVGFMVSALARSGVRTVEERSDIVMVRWP